MQTVNDNDTSCVPGFHLTPVVKYRDDLTFTLTPLSEEACLVEGFSTSTVSIYCIYYFFLFEEVWT